MAAPPARAQCAPPPVATQRWRRGGPSATWAAPCLRRPHRAATRKALRARAAREPTLRALRARYQARRLAASARSPPPGEGSGTAASSAAGAEGWAPMQRLRWAPHLASRRFRTMRSPTAAGTAPIACTTAAALGLQAVTGALAAAVAVSRFALRSRDLHAVHPRWRKALRAGRPPRGAEWVGVEASSKGGTPATAVAL